MKRWRALLISFLLIPFFAGASEASKTIDLVAESLYLNGADIPHIARGLRKFLQQNFRVKADCDQSFLTGLSDVECAMGLRNLARAIYSGELPNAEQYSPILEFTIQGGKFKIEIEDGRFRVDLPYDLRREDLQVLIDRALLDPKLPILASQNRLLQDEWTKLRASLPFEIIDDLPYADQWDAILKLSQIAKTWPSSLAPAFEVLRLGHEFKGIYEKSMFAEVAIDTRQDLATLDTFLRQEANPKGSEKATLEGLLERRKKMQSLRELAADKFKIQLDCRSDDGLSSQNCVDAMARFLEADAQNRFTNLPPVLIVDPASLSDCCYLAESETLAAKEIALRGDFKVSDLKAFLIEKGWLK